MDYFFYYRGKISHLKSKYQMVTKTVFGFFWRGAKLKLKEAQTRDPTPSEQMPHIH